MSYEDHTHISNGPTRPYEPTCEDIHNMGDAFSHDEMSRGIAGTFFILFLIDLPFTFIADTLLLPWDFWNLQYDKKVPSKDTTDKPILSAPQPKSEKPEITNYETAASKWNSEQDIDAFEWLNDNAIKKGDDLSKVIRIFGNPKMIKEFEDKKVLYYIEINGNREFGNVANITIDKNGKYESSFCDYKFKETE